MVTISLILISLIVLLNLRVLSKALKAEGEEKKSKIYNIIISSVIVVPILFYIITLAIGFDIPFTDIQSMSEFQEFWGILGNILVLALTLVISVLFALMTVVASSVIINIITIIYVMIYNKKGYRTTKGIRVMLVVSIVIEVVTIISVICHSVYQYII